MTEAKHPDLDQALFAYDTVFDGVKDSPELKPYVDLNNLEWKVKLEEDGAFRTTRFETIGEYDPGIGPVVHTSVRVDTSVHRPEVRDEPHTEPIYVTIAIDAVIMDAEGNKVGELGASDDGEMPVWVKGYFDGFNLSGFDVPEVGDNSALPWLQHVTNIMASSAHPADS